MAKLPKGYIDMTRGEYTKLDIETQRAIYVALRDIVRYTAGKDKTDGMICAGYHANEEESPIEWLLAVKRAECDCERCKGTGTYYWGASVNGKMSCSAPCARCGGDGRMTFDDMRRGKAYDNHAIIRACRG